MKKEKNIFLVLLFPLINVNAFTIAFNEDPVVVAAQTCSPVRALCGQEARTVVKYFSFNTVNSDLGMQLGWTQTGTVWSFVYEKSITAPPLNSPPHNGTGNGYNSAAGVYAIMETKVYEQEYRINEQGVAVEYGPSRYIRSVYREHFESQPSVYYPCKQHEE